MVLDSLLYKGLKEAAFRSKSQGRGILRRARVFRKEWSSHQNKTKSVIQDWLKANCPKGELNILGAGPLLDLPVIPKNRFSRLFLTDVNPECLRIWRKNHKRFPSNTEFLLQDVTLSLDKWLTLINHTQHANIPSFLNFIKQIPKIYPPEGKPFYKANHNLSLNLTSQLPIYWQEAVFHEFRSQFGLRECKTNHEAILEAMLPSAQALIKTHLESLIPGKKGDSSLIITDLLYFFPESMSLNVSILEPKTLPPKFTFKSNGPKESLSLLQQDALYGFNLEAWIKTLPSGVSHSILDSWIWKIVPMPTKGEALEFHLVTAIKVFK